MDGGVAFVADPQPTEVVQVREAALHDPALAPESGAVLDAASGDDGFDATRPEDATVLVKVVAAVGQQPVGALARPTDLAADRAGVQLVKQRNELGDVVAVAAGQCDRKRDAGRVDEQVVLGACAGTIDWGWPRQEPPKRARTCEPSTAARDQSIAPAALSLISSCSCRRSHTPACCQSRNLRQHVTPEP